MTAPSPAAVDPAHVLSDAEVEHFINQGYLHRRGVIPREVALENVEAQFKSVGWDAHQPAQWQGVRRSFPQNKRWLARELAPRFHAAACQILGGAQRLRSADFHIDNGMTANLAEDEGKPWRMPDEKGAWHKDGYFFRHFLDSPEQALLALVCWSDIVPQGGATGFAPQSVGAIARYLAAHPEGVHPNHFPYAQIIRDECPNRLEAVAEAGDILLMHSYMLHTVAPNPTRKLRCISNMIVSLAEPMQFNRANSADHSPLERTVLRGLGVERYDFKPTRERVKTPDYSPLPDSMR